MPPSGGGGGIAKSPQAMEDGYTYAESTNFAEAYEAQANNNKGFPQISVGSGATYINRGDGKGLVFYSR